MASMMRACGTLLRPGKIFAQVLVGVGLLVAVLLLRLADLGLCMRMLKDEAGGRSVATSVPSPSRRALMTIEAVADRLGVSVRHVRRLVAERRIPYLKWGHLLRFDASAIDRWLEERSVPVRTTRASGR